MRAHISTVNQAAGARSTQTAQLHSSRGFIGMLGGPFEPVTPRRWALATSQQHISEVEPPRGASRSVGRRRPSTNFASRRSTARGGSFAELQRTRVLRANLHCVQHRAATRADGALSALQGSDRIPRVNAAWGRSQSRAAVVVLPRSVPCGADVLSRRCDIIAQATSEGSPVTRRDAARRVSDFSCGVLLAFWGVT